MISTGQILAASVITALAVAVATGAVRWALPRAGSRGRAHLRPDRGLALGLEPRRPQR